MIESLVNLALMFGVFLACLGSGRVLLRAAGLEHKSLSEELVFATGLGFACAIYILVVLGFLGLLYPTAAWLLLGGGLAVSGRWLARQRPLRVPIPRPRIVAPAMAVWLAGAVLAASFIVYALTALSPTLEGDSTAGYLLVAKEYAARHALETLDHAYVTSYPQNGQMLSTWGFMLRGQILGQLLVSFAMGALFMGVMYAAGRTYVSRKAALIGMAIIYGTYSMGYLHASGKIDLAWAAFELLSIFAFSRQGIGTMVYYPQPLHRQELFWGLGYSQGSLPVSEQAAREVLSLPMFPELTASQQERVADAIQAGTQSI